MQGLRLARSDDNTISENLNQKILDAGNRRQENLHGRSTLNELTQMSLAVFAALKHVHYSLQALLLQVWVASRCHFVGSSHGPEKTAQLGEHNVSIFQSTICFSLSI